MPGPVSQPYEPQICRCEHFKEVHEGGTCQAPGCSCRRFRKMPFERSKLGQAMDAFIAEASAAGADGEGRA
jgi:hypothetical protein